MTCLMDRVLSGALIKLHTSMLGTFFVYTLAQSIPIFNKKSLRIFLGERIKLCIVDVTLLDFIKWKSQSFKLPLQASLFSLSWKSNF